MEESVPGVRQPLSVPEGAEDDEMSAGPAAVRIVEPLAVKEQIIKSATEAASMILRIDDVIASSKSGGGPPGPPGGMGGMGGMSGMPGMGGMGGMGGMPPMGGMPGMGGMGGMGGFNPNQRNPF